MISDDLEMTPGEAIKNEVNGNLRMGITISLANKVFDVASSGETCKSLAKKLAGHNLKLVHFKSKTKGFRDWFLMPISDYDERSIFICQTKSK